MNHLVPQGERLPRKLRAKPTIITLDDGRQISSNGLYTTSLVAEWIAGLGDRWVLVPEIARFAKHNAQPSTKQYVRRKMRELVKYFRAQSGLVLLVEYGGDHNAASAVKVYRGSSQEDEQVALGILEKMRERKDATEAEIFQMNVIIVATRRRVA